MSMSGFTVPGLMTISSIGPQYTAVFRTIARAALETGRYKRVVIPGCGTFHMVQQARAVGWKPEQIECSDIALISGLMGYYVNSKPLDDLNIQIAGHPEPMVDAPTVAYLQLMARYEAKGDVYYWKQILLDMERRREAAIQEIREPFDRARILFAGCDYRLQCFFEHLAEVLDDSETLVLMNPPCKKAGYEAFYNDKGRVQWKQPPFRVFDMEKEMGDLAAIMMQGRALCVVLEESDPGRTSMPAVYARASTRRSVSDPQGCRTMNSYFTTNRLDEVEELLGQRMVARKANAESHPSKYRMLPQNYEFKADSKVLIEPLEAHEALYYRLLWTHNFMPGSGAAGDWAIIVDGFLAAVFGYRDMYMRLERPGCTDAIAVHYGIGIPGHPRRLARLINRMNLCREVINRCVDEELAPRVARLRTMQITKHPESKDKRGMMTLTNRREQKNGLGFELIYEAPVIEESMASAFAWWLKDEESYWTSRRGSHTPKARHVRGRAMAEPAMAEATA